MNTPVYITAWGSLSGMGTSPSEVWKSLTTATPRIRYKGFEQEMFPVSTIDEDSESLLFSIASENKNYRRLDRATLLAIAACRKAVATSGWLDCEGVGISIGSARGATETWEKAHALFLKEGLNENCRGISAYTSPLTTLGNIASWAAHSVSASGVALSHSMTCSSAAHAIVNGVAWIQSGLCNRFLAGGSEAPLTPFTLAQMKALRLYSSEKLDSNFFCRPLGVLQTNTLVLGEGAAVFALEADHQPISTRPLSARIEIEAMGLSQEQIGTATSMSADGHGLQEAMKMALASGRGPIDVLLPHAPGTLHGDSAECDAIEQVFKHHKIPFLTSNKWCIGHCFGASAALSTELAILTLLKQEVPPLPYACRLGNQTPPTRVRRVMVNSTGFGGNAVSIILSTTAEN